MVRLYEFNNEITLDYDLMDDMYHYMMNDDDFYRKHYYPAMNKAKQTGCLLYTSPSPRDKRQSRMPSSA